MALDRRARYELVQALLRAQNRKYGDNPLENVAQTGAASDDGSYGQLMFGGTRFPSTSQPRVHDELASNEASSTSPRLANPQTTYGQPLALNTWALPQQGYWDSFWEGIFPSYCPSTDDNPTFPPFINQDKEQLTEADKTACHEEFEHNQEQCYKNYNYNRGARRRCSNRAETIRDLCLRGAKETLHPWSDVDEDGVRFPTPGKGPKKK